MIKVLNELKTYEESSVDEVFVSNHWSDKRFVVIEINNEKVILVARDLQLAITNAINT